MSASTVYLVTNLLNGYTYVGVTRFTPEFRWAQHVVKARNGYASHLYRAIRKYGSAQFSIEPLASCLSREHSGHVERTIIQRLAPVYNQTNGGEVTIGRRGGPDVYARIAAKNRGKRRTVEQNAANSAQAKARHKNNPAYRAVVLDALRRGRANCNQEKRKAAAAAACRARVLSTESRARLSAAQRGRSPSRGTIERAIEANKKPVECIELKTVFDSVSEAAEGTGVSITSVSRICLGHRNSANGLTFQFVNHH